ncbi:hypothetical protein HMPREF1013_01323 [Bacillus sp. 2_A_57_CT2]|nr:hypothetical protein HMPREF1013_01323 [Bacillus sp. 2_A_57_CT2]
MDLIKLHNCTHGDMESTSILEAYIPYLTTGAGLLKSVIFLNSTIGPFSEIVFDKEFE